MFPNLQLVHYNHISTVIIFKVIVRQHGQHAQFITFFIILDIVFCSSLAITYSFEISFCSLVFLTALKRNCPIGYGIQSLKGNKNKAVNCSVGNIIAIDSSAKWMTAHIKRALEFSTFIFQIRNVKKNDPRHCKVFKSHFQDIVLKLRCLGACA